MSLLLFYVFVAVVPFVDAAQFTMTASQFINVKVGSPFHLTWENATGPVTLILKNGASTNLVSVETIASGLTGTSYSWTPESTLPSEAYAFEIDDSGAPNYSEQFTLQGASSSSSSASSTSPPPTTKTSSTTSPAPSQSQTQSTSSASSAKSPSTSSSATIASTTPSITSSISSTSLQSSSSSFQTSASSITSSTSTSLTATSTPPASSGLSTGSKAAIGVGTTLGVLLFAAFGAFAFWYGKRAARRSKDGDGITTSNQAELAAGTPTRKELEDTSVPLSGAEKAELQRRRRAVELEAGSSPTSHAIQTP